MASFLDSFFGSFDYALLSFFHSLALSFGNILTPLSKFLAVTDNLPLLIVGYIGIFLIFTKKYRKIGITMVVSLIIGALIASIIIKPLVLRARPYQSDIEVYKTWWQFAGCSIEKDTSFPSGHTTAAMSSMCGLFLASKNKKVSWLVFIYPIVIACSRIYLCVHYPSDTLGGLLVGLLAALLANLIVSKTYKRRSV